VGHELTNKLVTYAYDNSSFLSRDIIIIVIDDENNDEAMTA
jgi:hypothetical protein